MRWPSSSKVESGRPSRMSRIDMGGSWCQDRFLSERDLVHDFDAKSFQRDDFPRMIGEQPDGVQPQVGQNLGADAVFVLQLALAGFLLIMHEIAVVRDHAALPSLAFN